MVDQGLRVTMPERRPLVEQVISSLGGLIEQDNLGPGDRLPSESLLATRFGVGRSTIREAVRALSHSGVLQARQGSGTFVSPVRRPTELERRVANARVAEVFEVRQALETLIAQIAPRRRSPEHLARMRDALEQCRKFADRDDVPAFVTADAQFHLVTAEATGNSVLVEVYAGLRRSLEDANVSIADLVELHHANELHAVLLEAIADGDPRAAVSATRRHLRETVKHFQSALG